MNIFFSSLILRNGVQKLILRRIYNRAQSVHLLVFLYFKQIQPFQPTTTIEGNRTKKVPNIEMFFVKIKLIVGTFRSRLNVEGSFWHNEQLLL